MCTYANEFQMIIYLRYKKNSFRQTFFWNSVDFFTSQIVLTCYIFLSHWCNGNLKVTNLLTWPSNDTDLLLLRNSSILHLINSNHVSDCVSYIIFIFYGTLHVIYVTGVLAFSIIGHQMVSHCPLAASIHMAVKLLTDNEFKKENNI